MLKENTQAMFAVCIDNTGHEESLQLHKIYTILPDENAAEENEIRVVDETEEDYLYPARRFMIIDVPQALARELLRVQRLR